ncbi:MAG: DUF4434 domain-containing protein, partial [Dysgonamonadaceae bacterium]
MFRRDFIKTLGASFVMGNIIQEIQASPLLFKKNIKPIEGSWFEFQHHSLIEGKYWNPALESFTAEQWEDKIKEIAECGIRYLVLLDTAIYGKSFYPSHILPKHQLGCDDPLETVLSAADKYGIRFFISNGFYGEWTNPAFLMKDEATHKLRLKAMNEIAEKYAHHKSFYGWYYPNETGINGYYDDIFINYVNNCSREAYKLTPKAKTLIAPYGTRNVIADEKYLKQLDLLNVDFIAYQDEVGVEKTAVEESGRFFERLYNLHKKAAKSRLWADIEVFKFEGTVYK